MGRRRRSMEQRETPGALLGQPSIQGNLSPELSSALDRARRVGQPEIIYHWHQSISKYGVPKHIRDDSSWQHVMIQHKGKNLVISFRHLGNGRLSVHSREQLNWDEIGWLVFSLAHEQVISRWKHSNGMRTSTIKAMERQVFTARDFHIGYPGEERTSEREPTLYERMDTQWRHWGLKGFLAAAGGIMALEAANSNAQDPYHMLMRMILLYCYVIVLIIVTLLPIMLPFLMLFLLSLIYDKWDSQRGQRLMRQAWDEQYQAFLPRSKPPLALEGNLSKAPNFVSKSAKTARFERKSPSNNIRAQRYQSRGGTGFSGGKNYQRARR